MNRRYAAVAVVLAMMTVTSGCALLSSGPITFSANKATVSAQAQDQAGYEEVTVESQVVNRTFEAAGQSKQVTVTNWLAQYERTISIPTMGERRAGVVAVFASPQVQVVGQSFNPLADMTDREILRRFASQYEDIEVGQKVGEQNITVLGHDRALSKYEGTATLGGQNVDVYIHLTRVKDDGDYIVGLAIYPQRLDGEEERVVTMMEGIEHASDESSD